MQKVLPSQIRHGKLPACSLAVTPFHGAIFSFAPVQDLARSHSAHCCGGTQAQNKSFVGQ
jgi:hypothetical protein